MKQWEAYDKIDNTICLNFNEDNNRIKFNIDGYEHIDCVDYNEMFNSLDTIRNCFKAYEIIINKKVNIGYFLNRLSLEKLYNNYFNYNEYKEHDDKQYEDFYSCEELSEEEFTLLKEILWECI